MELNLLVSLQEAKTTAGCLEPGALRVLTVNTLGSFWESMAVVGRVGITSPFQKARLPSH